MGTREFYRLELESLPTKRRKLNFLNKSKAELSYREKHMNVGDYFMGDKVTHSSRHDVLTELKIVNEHIEKINLN